MDVDSYGRRRPARNLDRSTTAGLIETYDDDDNDLPDGACHSTSVSLFVNKSFSERQSAVRECQYVGSFAVAGQDHESRAEYVKQQLTKINQTKTKKVLLVVSLSGIKVCCPGGKSVYMAHALRRISYATCDPTRSLFSFVAREPKGHYSLQYCHALSTSTPEQAEELNNLVGNAFRLAFAQQFRTANDSPTIDFNSIISEQIESLKGIEREDDNNNNSNEVYESTSECSSVRNVELPSRNPGPSQATDKTADSRQQHRSKTNKLSGFRKFWAKNCKGQHKEPVVDRYPAMNGGRKNAAAMKMTRFQIEERGTGSGCRSNAPPDTLELGRSRCRRFDDVSPSPSSVSSDENNLSPIDADCNTTIVDKPVTVKRFAVGGCGGTVEDSSNSHGPPDLLNCSVVKDSRTNSAQCSRVLPSSDNHSDINDDIERRQSVTDANNLNAKSWPTKRAEKFVLICDKDSGKNYVVDGRHSNDKRSSAVVVVERSSTAGLLEPDRTTAVILEDKKQSRPQRFCLKNEIKKNSRNSSVSLPPPLPERHDSLTAASHYDENELRCAPWFQAGIPREIALEILSREPIGAFMVRESTTKPDCFALSLRVPQHFQPTGISHYLILKTNKGYKIKGFTKEFGTLTALITHHSVMPELLPCTLSLSRYNPNFSRRDSSNGDNIVDLDDDPDYETLSDFRKMMSDLDM